MTSGHRHDLPQARGEVLLADGGLETTLIFHRGFDLPEFAAFPLLDTEDGREALLEYFRPYLATAVAHRVGIVLETPTWRASADWGARVGYDDMALRRANSAAVDLLRELRAEYESDDTSVVISGCVGPRGDGYVASESMTAEEADAYHAIQVQTFADAGVDLVTLVTATSSPEAIGFVLAAERAGVPAVVSFTVETDGAIPTGQRLGDAIEEVDAATGAYATLFGINCAHPDHFSGEFTGSTWEQRIGLIRANASRQSHEELDNAEELDAGDAAELARLYSDLRLVLPNITVMGGCCGTDDSHISAIAEACFGPPPPRPVLPTLTSPEGRFVMDTLVEEMERLRSVGYVNDFSATANGHLRCEVCRSNHDPAMISIAETVRFEGDSNPDDESILLALVCECGARGQYSAAFGPDTPAEDALVLRTLARHRP